jgi:hypothetical protein
VPGDQQQPDEADDLVIAQPLPVGLHPQQLAGEVVAGVLPAGTDVVEEVAVHLPDGRRGPAHRLLAGAGQ